ncbi:MAG: hypothetical protein RIS92_3104, partial [Verrucomicrobiota bacterium]
NLHCHPTKNLIRRVDDIPTTLNLI